MFDLTVRKTRFGRRWFTRVKYPVDHSSSEMDQTYRFIIPLAVNPRPPPGRKVKSRKKYRVRSHVPVPPGMAVDILTLAIQNKLIALKNYVPSRVDLK